MLSANFAARAAKQVELRSTDLVKSVSLIQIVSPFSSKATAFDEGGATAWGREIFVYDENLRIERELRRTPSGKPKLKFWLSLLIPKIFSYPLKNKRLFKKSVDFLNSLFPM